MIRRASMVAAAVALLAAPASAFEGPAFTVAHGTVASPGGGFPWSFTAEHRRTAGIPTVCVSLVWAWEPGQRLANGGTECTTATVGGRFNLYAGPLNGLYIAGWVGSIGDDHVRLVGVLADRRVARLRVTTKDGARHRLRTRLAPRGLRRRLRTRLRVAWLADADEALPARAVGYSRRGRRLAGWRSLRRRGRNDSS